MSLENLFFADEEVFTIKKDKVGRLKAYFYCTIKN